MQSQERELISGLFGRLQPFEAQQRDGEAEALIRDFTARQPASPYLLVQTVLVQEHALKAAQERIAELEAKVAAGASAPGFLGSAPKIGPWGAAPASAQAPQPPQQQQPMMPQARSPLQAALSPQQGAPQPWGMQQGAPQPSAGGGFLRSAMTTAAGVAGGALLFEGIRGLLGGSSNPFGSQAAMAQPVQIFEQAAPQNYGSDSNPVPDDFRDNNNNYDNAAYDNSGSGQDDNGYDSSNDDMGSSDSGSSDDDSWI